MMYMLQQTLLFLNGVRGNTNVVIDLKLVFFMDLHKNQLVNMSSYFYLKLCFHFLKRKNAQKGNEQVYWRITLKYIKVICYDVEKAISKTKTLQ